MSDLIYRRRKIIMEFLTVSVMLLGLNYFIIIHGLDMKVQSLFFDGGSGWYLGNTPIFKFLYTYGELIPLIPVILSGILLLLGFVRVDENKKEGKGLFNAKIKGLIEKIKIWRKKLIFIILLMVIGPGLIINAGLKNNLGRPRPREVIEFGGTHGFIQPWAHGQAGPNSSFPSGHSSVAFYMFFPFFLLRDKKRTLGYFFLFMGIFYGLIMGLARIAQGGHFASDVIWSGGIVYLTGLVLYFVLRLDIQV